MAVEVGLVLGWQLSTEIGHLKTRLDYVVNLSISNMRTAFGQTNA
jgi:hypothetical protein